MAESGIYEIRNLVNGKRYVGSAVDFRQRWWEHQSCIRRGKHHSVALQRAFAKYGEVAFDFRTIERCDPDELIVREQHYIDTLKPEYNCCPTAGSSRGLKHSEETRKKVGAASKRKWQDPETRAKLMKARKEAWDDPERRAKGIAAAKRKWADPEFRAKVSASHAKREVTQEFKDAVRAGIRKRIENGLPFARQINPCRGRKMADATKEKLRQANLGKKRSAETRAKMSVPKPYRRGEKRSEQARANIRAGQLRRRAALSK